VKVVGGVLDGIIFSGLGKGIIGVWYSSGLLAARGYVLKNILELPAVVHIPGGRAAISRSRLPH
jgi:hypothetical protein